MSIRVWLRSHEEGNNGYLSRDQAVEQIFGFLAASDALGPPIEGRLFRERLFVPQETVDPNATAATATGTITVVGYAPTVDVGGAVDFTASPGVGVVTVAGLAPTLSAGATAATGAGAVTVLGRAPTVAASASMTPSTGVVTVAGFAPTVAANSTAAPGVGAVTVTGFAPTVDTAGNVTLSPDTGVVTVTGFAPTVIADVSVTVLPGVGVITIAGHAPTIDVGIPPNSIAGGRRRKVRLVEIAGKTVELKADDPLVEVAERVEKALKSYRPVEKADVRKLARLPGVKAALERAIRERDDEEAALMMLVA